MTDAPSEAGAEAARPCPPHGEAAPAGRLSPPVVRYCGVRLRDLADPASRAFPISPADASVRLEEALARCAPAQRPRGNDRTGRRRLQGLVARLQRSLRGGCEDHRPDEPR